MSSPFARLLPSLAVAFNLTACMAVSVSGVDVATLANTESALEPVRYTGKLQPDKYHFDGMLPHAVGVHNIQTLRANRSRPPGGGAVGYTYNHQPYLAYWNGQYYLQYLNALTQEHEPPCNTSIVTSADGYTWSPPRVVFPEYTLPEINQGDIHIEAGTIAVMHQRMGFYVAPNGRLLTLGFYGFCATPQHSPNAGNGLGRVVREIHADGSLGPVYFIRYNRHAGFDERNTTLPFYRTSTEAGFVEACEALLADKLYTLQWWEEDRAKDGFYTMSPDKVAGAAEFNAKVVTSEGAGKAFAWFTRPDGVTVGLWKNQYTALSPDHGQTWTPIVKNTTLRTTGAKTWGQHTDDNRYVIVHAHSATMMNRFPMVAITGDDGHIFDTLLCMQGEVPLRRYRGQYKNTGLHYFRGICEGNGNPPGNHLWMTYSINKEDIWISRTALPISGKETAPLREDFEGANDIADLTRWNFHMPLWAQARIVSEPAAGSANIKNDSGKTVSARSNKVLELRDEEPWDYLIAERVFPASKQATIQFRVQTRQAIVGAALEIEVQSQDGKRPMRLRLNDRWLSCDRAKRTFPQLPVTALRWYNIELTFDCVAKNYTLRVDGAIIQKDIPFAEAPETVERIVFRTGTYRGLVSPLVADDGGERPGGLEYDDLPGADDRATPAVYWIDDLTTR